MIQKSPLENRQLLLKYNKDVCKGAKTIITTKERVDLIWNKYTLNWKYSSTIMYHMSMTKSWKVAFAMSRSR